MEESYKIKIHSEVMECLTLMLINECVSSAYYYYYLV